MGANHAQVAGLSVPGHHFCALWRDEGELGRVAATFASGGLAAGDQVLYVAGDRTPPAVRESLDALGVAVAATLATGQLVVRTFAEYCKPPVQEEVSGLAARFWAAAVQWRAAGFAGLRVAVEMGDIARAAGSIDRLLGWEPVSSRLLAEQGISCVCLYERRLFNERDAQRLAAEHAGTAPASAPAPQASFLATDNPWGLRVTGEVDLTNRDLLARMLRARLQPCPLLQLDAAELSFADVGTLSELYRIAAALPEEGCILVVNASARLQRLIELTGLRHPRVVIKP